MQTSENTAPKLQRDYLLHKRLQRLVGEAVKDLGLIEPEDRILIGLSGGKDSLALLDLMGERMKRSNGYFSLEAVHVRMSNIQYESDTSYLEQKAAAWGVPFHVVETGFEADRNEKRTPCFLCSWNRRKTLFSVAQNLGCTKIALGHHQGRYIEYCTHEPYFQWFVFDNACQNQYAQVSFDHYSAIGKDC